MLVLADQSLGIDTQALPIASILRLSAPRDPQPDRYAQFKIFILQYVHALEFRILWYDL